MNPTGLRLRAVLLLCFVSSTACNMFAFTEEPSDRVGKADGYCSRILRAQSNRREENDDFRLRVEGDPESYQPGNTYRGEGSPSLSGFYAQRGCWHSVRLDKPTPVWTQEAVGTSEKFGESLILTNLQLYCT